MPRGSHRIRRTRTKLGWSQLDLACRSELGTRTIQFAESGREEVKFATLAKIAAALELTTADVICDDEALAEDQFKLIPWSLSGLLRARAVPSSNSYCCDEETARETIVRMRQSWETHLDNTRSAGDDNLYGVADRKLDAQVDRCVERYLNLWRRLPETIQLATDGDEVFGASVALPVTDTAFRRLCDGEITFMDVGPDDLQENSQNIILDSAVEFAGTGNPEWYRFTASLSYTVFYQIAKLSRAPSEASFRMVSFSASPLNSERLFATGFRSNGVTMPVFEYPLCVFSTAKPKDFDDQYIRSSTTAHFTQLVQGLCDDAGTVAAPAEKVNRTDVASTDMMDHRRWLITRSLSLIKRWAGSVDAADRFDTGNRSDRSVSA